MPKILTLTVELTDIEWDSFMKRMAERATGGDGDGEEGEAGISTATHDSEGRPFNPAIDAETHGVTNTGVWRRKRGVLKTTADKVKAEMKAAGLYLPTPGPAATVTAALAPMMPGMPGALPPGYTMPAAVVAPPPPPPVSWEALCARYTALATAGKISEDIIRQIYIKTGVNTDTLQTNESDRVKVMNELALFG